MRRNGCGEVLAVIEHGRRVAGVLTLSAAGIVEIFGVSGDSPRHFKAQGWECRRGKLYTEVR